MFIFYEKGVLGGIFPFFQWQSKFAFHYTLKEKNKNDHFVNEKTLNKMSTPESQDTALNLIP